MDSLESYEAMVVPVVDGFKISTVDSERATQPD